MSVGGTVDARERGRRSAAGEKPRNAGVAARVGRAASAVVGRPLGRLRLPRRTASAVSGAAPGVEPGQLAGGDSASHRAVVTCIDYGPGYAHRHQVAANLPAFLDAPAPEGAAVRWINVDGLSDGQVLSALAEHYGLHPLALEDVLHVPQRPKAELYAAQDHQVGSTSSSILFVVTRMLYLRSAEESEQSSPDAPPDEPHADRSDARQDQQPLLDAEQVSLFLGPGFVLTVQERPGDVWDEVRRRIERAGSRLRDNDASFLLYALLDAIVDNCFPTLEYYADRLERLENQVLDDNGQDMLGQIHAVKHELMMLRREVWPMREMVTQLQREEQCFSPTAQLYMRDVHDHALQVIDLIESCRESATGLAETYMSAVSNRMNDVMKTLTMIASIFIPVSFLAGVFGMNFEHIPGLKSPNAFFFFCAGCVAVGVGMGAWFKHKGWW